MRTLHWFRSDLRLADNTALAAAAAAAGDDPLLGVYVLDARLLAGSRCGPPRARFLADCLERLAGDLEARGNALLVVEGRPEAELPRLARDFGCARAFWNRDYSPFARARDAAVTRALEAAGVGVETHKDRVVFEADEIRTQDGRPYAVYSPYKRRWYERFGEQPAPPRRAPALPHAPEGADRREPLAGLATRHADDPTRLPTGGSDAGLRRLRRFCEQGLADYPDARDRMDLDGTSRLSPYLRLGAVSVRQCIAAARDAAADDRRKRAGADKWIDELVWREFYHMILAEHPHVTRTAYREDMRSLRWTRDAKSLEAWQQGRTGYPVVDAAMRQLLAIGWIHNRARMVAASFLCKDLGLDWRAGERWFMERLVDGDPASNNGGWQWSASTGTDAQPWFRIFNPTRQGERFDPEGDYVRRWIPELANLPGKSVHEPWKQPMLAPDYPPPIVDHAQARERTLARFKAATGKDREGLRRGGGE